MARLSSITFLVLFSSTLCFGKTETVKEKKEILTLSGGKYIETFDQDSVEQIGKILYNVYTEKIVGFVTEETPETAGLSPEIISRWLSVDPLAAKYPSISPYVYCADDPIRKIDPDGQKFLNFNSNGDYIGNTHDNFFHNLFFRQGRIVNDQGETTRQFRFADRKNDVKDIENGTITKLVSVTEGQMKSMVARSGGFDAENKTANRGFSDRYDYIKQEGTGGGKMDFSYTQIPGMFPGASTNPLQSPSSMIFLPPSASGESDYAHNQMNFGNYLFGASGQAQGFSLVELSAGGHYNSLKNPGLNGYSRQFDSADDQFSIQKGYQYGQLNGYDKKEFKVEIGGMKNEGTSGN